MSNELTLNNENNSYGITPDIDIQITTAKAYPRDVKRFMEKAIALATFDAETAESCIYALPRGRDKSGAESFLKGKSIRLAEIVLATWCNLHAATRFVANDGKMITMESVVWDLETNSKVCVPVSRSILKRDGSTFSADMQIVTSNAAASISLRNAIFRLVPGALTNKVYQAALNFSIGDQTKLIQKVEALFVRFAKMGISSEKILSYFGKKSSAEITVEEVEEMIGFGTSIKEKTLKIDQAFEFDNNLVNNSKTDQLNEKLEAAAHAKKVADEFMGPED